MGGLVPAIHELGGFPEGWASGAMIMHA